MIETAGDIWAMPADALAITTNGIVKKDGCAVMGAGVARAAADRYPGIDQRLGGLLGERGNEVHILHRAGAEPWADEQRSLLAYPTKNHWREPSDLELMVAGARRLDQLASENGWQRVIMPRPGCGLGGLDWNREVRPALAPLLDDRFLISSGLRRRG